MGEAMVDVQIAAVMRINQLRFDFRNGRLHLFDQIEERKLVQAVVGKAEKARRLRPEDFGRTRGCRRTPSDFVSHIVAPAARRHTIGEEEHVNGVSRQGMPGHRAATPEYLVVRVRRDDEKPCLITSHASTRPCRYGALG